MEDKVHKIQITKEKKSYRKDLLNNFNKHNTKQSVHDYYHICVLLVFSGVNMLLPLLALICTQSVTQNTLL